MKNKDFESFLQRASVDPMQIGEEDAKRMRDEVRTALEKPLSRFIDSRLAPYFFVAYMMMIVVPPLASLVFIAGITIFYSTPLSTIDVFKAFGLVLWLAVGVAIFQLPRKIDANHNALKETDVLLSLVENNDRLVREAIDICSVVPKAQDLLSNIHQAHRSFRVMHLNAMRRLDTQNLAAQKVVERQQKSKAQDAQMILAERQTLQNLAT